MAREKARYFDFLVYPESAPEDWEEQLRKSLGAFAISPLHTPDEDEQKPHYHVMFYSGNGPITSEAAKRKIPEEVPANGYVEMTNFPRNYQRYLLHIDHPGKQQWQGNPSELIRTYNGFPLDLTKDFTQSERAQQRADIFEFIRDYNLYEYADLLDALMDSGKVDLFDYAANHTILYNTYLTSRREKANWMKEADK